MSTGAIVGVAVAMLFLVAVLAVVMLLRYCRQKRPQAGSRYGTEPGMFGPSADTALPVKRTPSSNASRRTPSFTLHTPSEPRVLSPQFKPPRPVVSSTTRSQTVPTLEGCPVWMAKAPDIAEGETTAVAAAKGSLGRPRGAASRQTTSGPTSLHGLTSTPTSDPKPSKHAQRLLQPMAARLTTRRAQLLPTANPPQLAGTLHKRSPTSGFYKKIKVSHAKFCYLLPAHYHNLLLTTHCVYCKVTIEGDTLRYADFKSDKYSVLHGSNVERLEVVNRAQFEFVLKTKTSGPERGRSYSFRVSTCATIQRPRGKCMQCRAYHAYACTTSVRQKETAARVCCVRVHMICDMCMCACVAPVTLVCLDTTAGALNLGVGRLVSSSGSARYQRNFPLARVTRPLPQPHCRRRRG